MNKAELETKRILALNLARQYCENHNLSFKKLEAQRFDSFNEILWFSQPSKVKPLGLVNDMETMPKPTLIIKFNGNEAIIEQTEYTKEYLSRKLSIILTGQNGNQSRVERSTLLFLYPNHRAAGIAAHFQQQTELYKNHVERKTNEKSHDYPHGARYRGAGGKEIRA